MTIVTDDDRSDPLRVFFKRLLAYNLAAEVAMLHGMMRLTLLCVILLGIGLAASCGLHRFPG